MANKLLALSPIHFQAVWFLAPENNPDKLTVMKSTKKTRRACFVLV